MYHSGYAAHPGVVHLRAGETFTRSFDRDHFGGPAKRRFWHHQAGGPFRNWTFANQGEPRHEGEVSNSRGNASYSNGVFVYRPPLGGDRWREGIVTASENVTSREGSLQPADGKPASVTFAHFSPYVICGDPADDANPMTGKATDGFVITGKASGGVRLEVSADQGQTWHGAGLLRDSFRLDLTDVSKGRYGWQARFSLLKESSLARVEFRTTTQVCQAIYPRLAPGGSEVTYRAASRAVVPVLPDFGRSEAETERFEERSLRSPNVAYQPRTKDSRFSYRTTNNKPGRVVFRIDSPTDLVEVTAAVRFGVRVPPPENCDFHLELSLDGGQTWSALARADMPADNEYSSGWMYGREQVTRPGTRQALVRANFYQGGYQTGIIEAQLYGVRRTEAPQASTVTYAWREGERMREHVEHVAPGKSEHRFIVPTGPTIADEFVRIAVAD
jgi:hypothetical protein